jgi:hypothetical protein
MSEVVREVFIPVHHQRTRGYTLNLLTRRTVLVQPNLGCKPQKEDR